MCRSGLYQSEFSPQEITEEEKRSPPILRVVTLARALAVRSDSMGVLILCSIELCIECMIVKHHRKLLDFTAGPALLLQYGSQGQIIIIRTFQ